MAGLAGSVHEGSIFEVSAVYDELLRVSAEYPSDIDYQPNDETYTLLFEAFLFHCQYDRLSLLLMDSSFMNSSFRKNLPQIRTLRRVTLQLAKEGMNAEVEVLLPLIHERNRGPVTALDMFLKRLKDIQDEVAKHKNEANMASTRQPISATIADDDDDDTDAKERKERRRAVRRIKPVERSEEEVAQQQQENKEIEDEEKKDQDPTAPLDFRAYYQRSKK
jgi:hypothetical protein